jgi:hypothetical protein
MNPLFEEVSLKYKNRAFNIIKVNISDEIFNKAVSQAKLKCQHTMEFNQAGNSRSNNIKYQKQLQGIIAEIAIKLLLEEFSIKNALNLQVIRWDDVRTDGFRSALNEYDIKIIYDHKEFFVESRSSISYKTTIQEAIIQLDIIGPYTNIMKKKEKNVDFYIRPLYQYVQLCDHIEDTKTEEHIKTGKMILYITGGITYDELAKKGYNGTLGQSSTIYRLIKIINAEDISNFLQTMRKVLTNKRENLKQTQLEL